jgi:hypothetical protein
MMSVPTLPSPPRRVRGLLAGGGEGWLGRIFILPHTLVGVGAAGFWIFLLLANLFGTDLQGVVTGTKTSHSRKGGTSYSAQYEYEVDGRKMKGSDGIGFAACEQFNREKDSKPSVQIQYFALGPWHHARLRIAGGFWREVGFMTLWVAFWNSIVGFFIYMIWIQPILVRQLYKHGLEAAGVITNKRARTGKSTSYYISYKFDDPRSGSPIQSEIQVYNHKKWNMASVGEPVTVLYAPDKLKRSTVYEYGGYELKRGFRDVGHGQDSVFR